MKEYKENIMHKSRTKTFVEVAKEMAGKKLMSEKWLFFPSYKGMTVVRIRVGEISPLVEKGWILAALLNEIDEGR